MPSAAWPILPAPLHVGLPVHNSQMTVPPQPSDPSPRAKRGLEESVAGAHVVGAHAVIPQSPPSGVASTAHVPASQLPPLGQLPQSVETPHRVAVPHIHPIDAQVVLHVDPSEKTDASLEGVGNVHAPAHR